MYAIMIDFSVARPEGQGPKTRATVMKKWIELTSKLKAAGWNSNKRFVDNDAAEVELKRLRAETGIKTLVIAKSSRVKVPIL